MNSIDPRRFTVSQSARTAVRTPLCTGICLVILQWHGGGVKLIEISGKRSPASNKNATNQKKINQQWQQRSELVGERCAPPAEPLGAQVCQAAGEQVVQSGLDSPRK